MVPADRIQIKVEKGWITLKGEVDWDYQRRVAEKAVRTLVGLVGVSNTITLKFMIGKASAARLRMLNVGPVASPDTQKRYRHTQGNIWTRPGF